MLMIYLPRNPIFRILQHAHYYEPNVELNYWTAWTLYFWIFRSIDFLTKVFELFPDYDFVVITVPHLVPEFPLLQSFVVCTFVKFLELLTDGMLRAWQRKCCCSNMIFIDAHLNILPRRPKNSDQNDDTNNSKLNMICIRSFQLSSNEPKKSYYLISYCRGKTSCIKPVLNSNCSKNVFDTNVIDWETIVY